MAFADTITITVNSVAKVLTRVNSGENYAAEYRLRGTLDEYRLRIRHTTYNDKVVRPGVTINRHNVELIHTIFPVAPSTMPTIRKTYIVLEEGNNDDPTAVLHMDNGFVGFLTSANITKLLNYES
nr:MAG: hypothetical protein 2 [Leviviridae sp.]